MALSDLIKRGDIKPFKAARSEVLDLIALAERDLLQSRQNLAEGSFDWSLVVSYNCILQTARAWVFFKGFRPAFGEGHVPVISFAISTLESSFGKEITVLDRLRSKRHAAVYEKAGETTEFEAKYALALAEKFLLFVKQKIKAN